MICVSLTEPTLDGMVAEANRIDCDVVEFRLDCLDDVSSADMSKLAAVEKPKIVTCMPDWEGGRFAGLEEDRLKILSDSLDYTDYMSIELKTETSHRDKLISEAIHRNVKTIVAYHDFSKTPGKEQIEDILRREKHCCADVAKVAFMPNDMNDVIRLLQVLVDKPVDISVIALSMGELGRISRVVGPLLGSYLTFASAGGGREAGPGQLTVDEVRTVLSILER